MDRYLKPSRFDCDPNAAGSDKEFKHWLTTFKNFAKSIKLTTTPSNTTSEGTDNQSNTTVADETGDAKLVMLINYLAANVYEYIADCTTFDQAINTLTQIYVKPVNEIYARYKLNSRKQTESEGLDTYIQDLHRLSKDCNFKDVTAEQHRQGYVRDSFVSGIRSKEIRQKLLEDTSLSMEQVFDRARTLRTAHTNAESFSSSSFSPVASTTVNPLNNTNNQFELTMGTDDTLHELETSLAATYPQQNSQSCFHCGHPRHATRSQCPAKGYKCQICGKIGHWERVCQSSKRTNNRQQRGSQSYRQQYQQPQYQQPPQQQQQQQQQQPPNVRGTSAAIWPTLATTSQPEKGAKTTAFCNIKIKNTKIKSLIDTGSLSCSFIDKQLALRLRLPIIPAVGEVSLANPSCTSKLEGQCFVDFRLQNRDYKNVRLYGHVQANGPLNGKCNFGYFCKILF